MIRNGCGILIYSAWQGWMNVIPGEWMSFLVNKCHSWWINVIWRVTSYKSGPSCSKLTTSLVNDSLKLTSSDMQICWNFLLKKCELLTFFSAKNIRILYIESAKTVNEMSLNELVKLTTLWTTGPWWLKSYCFPLSQILDIEIQTAEQ